MSAVYNPESEVIAAIERAEIDARRIRRQIEHVTREEDRRVLQRQLRELADDIVRMQQQLD